MTGSSDEWAVAPDALGLADTRLRFLTAAPGPATSVRRPILASWTRSRAHGVAADAVHVPYEPNPAIDTPLTRCAEPVLRRLAERLDGRAVSIILTDADGLVLSRRTSDRAFEARLDQVLLAPGFSFAERFVGTNGIGTALEIGAGTAVLGHEHYAENLEMFACAAVPIRDARTGRTAGAMNLTCARSDADDLLLTLAESTAEQIEQALVAIASRRELAVLDAYRRACRRSSGPVIAVSADALILNAAARTVLDAADQAALLGEAETLTAPPDGPPTRQRQLLPSGRWAQVHARAVVVDGAPAGAVLRVEFEPGPATPSAAVPARSALPGLVGTSAAWQQVTAQVADAYARGHWLALTGEAGVGKAALLHAAVRTQGRRAVVIDAAAVRLPDAAEVGAAVIVRRADLADLAGRRRLELWLGSLDPARTWVGVTLRTGYDAARLAGVLAAFATAVEVPPLRMHLDDVPALTDHFLGLLGHGQRPSCAADAQRVLLHANWPGNVSQLRSVLLDALQRRPSGVLTAADLPLEVHATNRRVLTQLESLERDAIARALLDAGGDKRAAAGALGISRATVYRKVRQYGIQPPR